jgi:elongation factor G
VVAGMGELHLEVQLERLRLDYGVEVRAGQPEVAYRETIRRAVELEHTLARQSGGGSGQWARVRLRLEPLERGAGFAFADEVVGGAVPRQFIPAVEAGVRDALGSGVKAGYPVSDLRVTLLGGAFHPVDSSELAFRTAAAQALREAMRQADPLLLEPLMRVEVVTPDEYLGAVLGDLSGRRGQVIGMEPGGGAQLVRAIVPLAALFGYSGALRSLSQGRASFSMVLAGYGELPAALASKVAARSAG